MKKTWLFPKILIALVALLTFSLPALAYEEINVQNGGTIKGNAKMSGNMPFPRVYHLILFPNIDMCAEVDTDDEMNRVLDDFRKRLSNSEVSMSLSSIHPLNNV